MNNLVNFMDAVNAKDLILDPQATMSAARFSLNELNQQRANKLKMLGDIIPDTDLPVHMASAFRAHDFGVLLDLLDRATTAIVTGEFRLKVPVVEYKIIEKMYTDSGQAGVGVELKV